MLKDVHCRQTYEDSCRWALSLEKKKALAQLWMTFARLFWVLSWSVKPFATLTSCGECGVSWK